MKKALFFGACVAGGVLGAKLIKKCLNKATENLEDEKSDKIKKTVNTVVSVGCVAVGLSCVYEALINTDTKASVSNMISFVNGAKLGIIDENTLKDILEASLPTFDKSSKKLVEAYVNNAFPELLGGE